MPTEGDLRVSTLLYKDSTITQLGKSIFRMDEIVRNANQTNGSHFFSDADSLLLKNDSDLINLVHIYLKRNAKSFSGFISEIYYSAKNWCYLQNNENLNELKSLQNQIDFSRSIVLLSDFTLSLLIIFIVTFILHLSFNPFLKKERVEGKNERERIIQKQKIIISLFTMILLFLFLVICRECYQICELNFNKRAFGNYVSYKRELTFEASSKTGLQSSQ